MAVNWTMYSLFLGFDFFYDESYVLHCKCVHGATRFHGYTKHEARGLSRGPLFLHVAVLRWFAVSVS